MLPSARESSTISLEEASQLFTMVVVMLVVVATLHVVEEHGDRQNHPV